MQQSNHSFSRKQSITFTGATVFGMAALLLGLALIIFAHYHERAYVFLALGAGSFMGGIAGIIGAGSKVKVALSYGLLALGIVGIIIGLNYLTNSYGSAPSPTHGYMAIALSLVAILVGIIGALIAQPKDGRVAFATVIMLGVIGSIGLVMLLVGMLSLVVLEYQEQAYLLLGSGALCLIGGIACATFAQSRARSTSC